MQSCLFIINILIFEGHPSFSCFWALSLGGFIFTRTLVVCEASIQRHSASRTTLPLECFHPIPGGQVFFILTFTFSWHRATVQGVPLLLVYGLSNQFWTHVSGCWLPATLWISIQEKWVKYLPREYWKTCNYGISR